MDRVLIVEDEPDIAATIRFKLERKGYRVATATDGDQAAHLFSRDKPDLVLLDLNLPGLCGTDLLQRFREEDADVPVIIVTSRVEEEDRISCLENGADDYVTKPFSVGELAARVAAVLRRARRLQDGSAQAHIQRVGRLRMDLRAHQLQLDGNDIPLSPHEFALMACFLKYPAMVYSRQMLLDQVWGDCADVFDRTVDVHIKRLRASFQMVDPDFNPVATVYGVGYKLNHEAVTAAK